MRTALPKLTARLPRFGNSMKGHHALDLIHEYGRIAGLDQDGVESHAPRFVQLLAMRIPGRRNERNSRGRRTVAEPARGFVTGDAGQVEIQNHHAGQSGEGHLDRLIAVGGGQDVVTPCAQIHRPHLQGVRIVVDEKHACVGRNHVIESQWSQRLGPHTTDIFKEYASAGSGNYDDM